MKCSSTYANTSQSRKEKLVSLAQDFWPEIANLIRRLASVIFPEVRQGIS